MRFISDVTSYTRNNCSNVGESIPCSLMPLRISAHSRASSMSNHNTSLKIPLNQNSLVVLLLL
jgi:hypothetical protein